MSIGPGNLHERRQVQQPHRLVCVSQFLQIVQNLLIANADCFTQLSPFGLQGQAATSFLDQFLFLLAEVFLFLCLASGHIL